MDIVIAKNALIAFGAMFTAIVMGFFAFMNLISTKEQKISEFRQQWIDSLRNSIAGYISSLSYLSVLYKSFHEEKDSHGKSKFEMIKDVEEIYFRLNESYNDIIFRINPIETDSLGKRVNSEFLEAVERSRELYLKSEFNEAVSQCEDIREKTKPLLKFEWNRVRKGELSYRISKLASILVLVVGVSLAFYSAQYIYKNTNGFSVANASVSPSVVAQKYDKPPKQKEESHE